MTKTVIVCDRCEREMPLASKIAAGTYCWDICLVCASTLTVAEIFARVVRLTAGESDIAWWPTLDEAVRRQKGPQKGQAPRRIAGTGRSLQA